MLWLRLVAKEFFTRPLGELMPSNTNWLAAIPFYLIFIFGILYFVVRPGLPTGSTRAIVLNAALYGLITYAIYDLTTPATLQNYPAQMVVVDMTWGIVLSSVVSMVSYLLGRRVFSTAFSWSCRIIEKNG